jgi:hypothetical protein
VRRFSLVRHSLLASRQREGEAEDVREEHQDRIAGDSCAGIPESTTRVGRPEQVDEIGAFLITEALLSDVSSRQRMRVLDPQATFVGKRRRWSIVSAVTSTL